MSQDIFPLLQDDVARAIVGICRERQTASAINAKMERYYETHGYSIPVDLAERVARRLQDLEQVGAMVFDKDLRTWTSSKEAIEVLDKYYP